MAITVVSGTPSGDRSLRSAAQTQGDAERGRHKRPGGGQHSMLHTTPAPQQTMPARTGGQGGQAILASSQHTSWHHQASE